MDVRALNIVAIAGSLRSGSYNRGLVRAALDLAPDGMRLTVHDLGDIPLFNADVEASGDPAPVRRLKEAIGAADALLIATPEYNRCVPGVLKNAIDWASRPPRQSVLTYKPVAIMGASTGGGGTARAQAHLRDGLGYTNSLVLPQPEVLVPFAGARFDEAGDLHDEQTEEAIRGLLVALADWIHQLREGIGRAA
ncbi:MAG TPA: NAD(P)H-dependent oxidoreductase [Candidatus Limnocylindrales bacterium]